MTYLYDVLGVPRDATEEEIKASYYRAAKRCHPDAGGDLEAFQRLQHAYATLSDPDERAYYDRTGRTGDRSTDERIEGQAREFFAKLLLQALDDPLATRNDIIKKGKQMAQEDCRNVKKQITDLERRRGRAEQLAKRFKSKDGKGTLPNDIYAHVQRDLAYAIEQGQERLKVLARLDEILDNYEFEVEERPTASTLTAQGVNSILNYQLGPGTR